MLETIRPYLVDPLAGMLVGFVTFGISTALAIWLYRKALPIARLSYVSNDAMIVARNHDIFAEELEIRFKGIAVPRVATTIVAFWNSGSQTIRGSDIVGADPLRIETAENVTLLQAYVLASTRQVLDPNIAVEQASAAIVNFDFLDPGDGFALFVAHSGTAGQASVLGTIRGVKGGPKRLRQQFRNRVLAVSWQTVAPTLVIALSIQFLPPAPISFWAATLNYGLTACVLAVAVALPEILNWQRLRDFPKEFRKDPRLAGVLPHLLNGA